MDIVVPDRWASLRQFTDARIALGRSGVSMPVSETLKLKMAHAHAKDAVFSVLNKSEISNQLNELQLPFVFLQSKAINRHVYLQRPDLGRRLSESATETLKALQSNDFDVCITLADGLSAEAVNQHAIPVITLLKKLFQQKALRLAPVCIVEEGRVAVSDDTGSLLNTKLSLVFIGERPGLSSPDSLGAYLTYAPQVGLTDERRNCVSNIRPQGLRYEEAANIIFYLVKESLQLQISGVALKDNSGKALQSSAC